MYFRQQRIAIKLTCPVAEFMITPGHETILRTIPFLFIQIPYPYNDTCDIFSAMASLRFRCER